MEEGERGGDRIGCKAIFQISNISLTTKLIRQIRGKCKCVYQVIENLMMKDHVFC